jgi:hypothetical protein
MQIRKDGYKILQKNLENLNISLLDYIFKRLIYKWQK